MSDLQNTARFLPESVHIFWFAIKKVEVNAKFSGHWETNIPQRNCTPYWIVKYELFSKFKKYISVNHKTHGFKTLD